jgi:hypothetical protein
MANPITATISGSLTGQTHEGTLEPISFSDTFERANGHEQKSTPVLDTDNKALVFDTAAVLGKAGDVQKVFLLVSSAIAVDIQLNGGVIQTLRGPEPTLLITGGPEVTTVQVIGVAGTSEGHVSMTKIVGAP